MDAFVDGYVEWREESAAVDVAYACWAVSGRADRRLAHAAYRAALDREEKAAAVYQVAAIQLVSHTS